MPNLLAGKAVVPEFIQHEAKPDAVVKVVRSLMEEADVRNRMISEFDAIVHKLGSSGASDRAARAIIKEIKEARSLDRVGGLPPSQRYGEPGETAAS
jgi:lipid-A-disaccharide synthase